jgi:F420-dependent oxidoreductase-like protein
MRIHALVLALLVPAVAVPAAPPVTFGVQMAPDLPYKDIVAAWKHVEELGYDSIWLNDHFMPVMGDVDQPQFEAWTLLAALAAQTQHARIGILVTGNTYRNPALLAKEVVTVDHASNGRLAFGIGAGWHEQEHRAYGFEFYTAEERAARLGEALEVITRLFRGGHPTFEGKYYRLIDAPFAPPPLQKPHPPIVIGGQGKKWIMPLVAKYADEWNVPVGVSPAGVKKRLDGIRAECARIGRSPCVRDVSVFLAVANLSSIPLAGPVTRLGARALVGKKVARSVLAGPPAEVEARIREYVDAGATSVIITTRPGYKPELLKQFAAEVVPRFRPEGK